MSLINGVLWDFNFEVFPEYKLITVTLKLIYLTPSRLQHLFNKLTLTHMHNSLISECTVYTLSITKQTEQRVIQIKAQRMSNGLNSFNKTV